MAKTEKEAAEIVCHKTMIQTEYHDAVGDDGSGYQIEGPHCIGSRCMAWGWLDPKMGEILEEAELIPGKSPEPIAGSRWLNAGGNKWVRRELIEVGDCGLKASMGPGVQL